MCTRVFEYARTPSVEERLVLQQRFEEAVQRDVDLVVLNDAPTTLACQALKYGRMIACPSPRVYHEIVTAWRRSTPILSASASQLKMQ
ncbi:MAG: hypothetical protein NZ699_13015 [Roseiflexus sp.]|nr:hypothetical protein [Roseiflexus sp.]MCS7290046.1 hypothetical protein [Roseiflexus sp.]MDW8148485.1 hypothetical protein [Roseiflexaceae bacterium]MDW8232149.1 hypothetical protein [Roseiflexaceae bacterium]